MDKFKRIFTDPRLKHLLLGVYVFLCTSFFPQLMATGNGGEDLDQIVLKTPDQGYVTVADKANMYDDAVFQGEAIKSEKEEPRKLNCAKVAEDLETFRREGLASLDLAEPSAQGVYSFGKKSLIKEAFNTSLQSVQDTFVNGITVAYTKAQACRVQGYPDAYTWERELGMVMARLVGDETLAGDTDLLLVQGVDAGDTQSLQVMASKLDKISRRLVENSMFLERYRGQRSIEPLYAMDTLDTLEGTPKSAGEVLEIARDVQGALNQIERMEVTPLNADRIQSAILDEMDRYEPCLQWTFKSYQTLADKGNPLAAAKAEALKYVLAGPRADQATSTDTEQIYDDYVANEPLPVKPALDSEPIDQQTEPAILDQGENKVSPLEDGVKSAPATVLPQIEPTSVSSSLEEANRLATPGLISSSTHFVDADEKGSDQSLVKQ